MNVDEGRIQIILRIFLDINYFNFALCDLVVECTHIIFDLDVFCRNKASSIM